MINFATLKGFATSKGNVTQIAKDGVILWALNSSKPIILEVEKITSNTYAGGTTYNNEQFILLDIYPKTNGTVKVTYGGVTKTITDTSGAAEPNAQQVFFGTFNGVSDSVVTPASGELTIEGAYRGAGCGSYVKASGKNSIYCYCIKNIIDFGEPVYIGPRAFCECTNLTLTNLPNSIVDIGEYAFASSYKLRLTSLPEGIKTIGKGAFSMETIGLLDGAPSQTDIAMCGGTLTLPSTLESIGQSAFNGAPMTSDGYVTYIQTVKMLSETPPKVHSGAFGGCNPWKYGTSSNGYDITPLTIVVPKGCGEAYRSAEGWSKSADYIVEES